MRFRSAFLLLLLTTAATALIVGCDSAGTTGEQPGDEPTENGSVNVALARSVNSDVPSNADSAFVRLWNPSTGYNEKRIVNVPDPGGQTQVSLTAPAEGGYRVGIMPTYRPDLWRILGYGESNAFTIADGDTTRTSVDVQPETLAVQAPSSLDPGETDTVTAVLNMNPPDFPMRLEANQDSSVSDNEIEEEAAAIGAPDTDSTTVEQFLVGDSLATGDSLYFSITRVIEPNDPDAWMVGERALNGYERYPEDFLDEFAIPVEGSDEGTVIIVFTRGEDGWERARRLDPEVSSHPLLPSN
ncbi:hypothetical protein [Salinibacter ruber]|uniref:hypothetical protein n=1 Tax=Salinibacter ruber TaxID=146919 RepID=UPI0020736F4D|nr:hypothetical protein [Salinibacter ruber]